MQARRTHFISRTALEWDDNLVHEPPAATTYAELFRRREDLLQRHVPLLPRQHGQRLHLDNVVEIHSEHVIFVDDRDPARELQRLSDALDRGVHVGATVSECRNLTITQTPASQRQYGPAHSHAWQEFR